ncbi:hypothetical protein TTHERM_00925780 (macronuclear) [Tetrahymena thermophila SB210]|uniref:Uncharacterized protein n=1 Tax=Tetrahymena thermophila (strain SB210) TaxID=312017 RepID=Q22DY1_TETTS|nr:hypothetical protein TTHERM_00925780 [Tetrahymena thermophila SB210]EAR83531.2 hypothetical protein TTHERM_00925780 [Tetrahymena thermophila SB210]|eukprot:XP_001031194.2 hypothetical protein TTHERM_00925780 [Tetrahymena thermophila SB210]
MQVFKQTQTDFNKSNDWLYFKRGKIKIKIKIKFRYKKFKEFQKLKQINKLNNQKRKDNLSSGEHFQDEQLTLQTDKKIFQSLVLFHQQMKWGSIPLSFQTNQNEVCKVSSSKSCYSLITKLFPILYIFFAKYQFPQAFNPKIIMISRYDNYILNPRIGEHPIHQFFKIEIKITNKYLS